MAEETLSLIKVRFAPSPTGYLHIGGARTALFNWMYARAQGGKFVLRIEDTDLERSKKEYESEILNSMQWLGLTWDELVYQSQRFEIYRKQADLLVNAGLAYRKDGAVFLSTEQIYARRQGQDVIVDDLIRGRIIFDRSFLLKRDDSAPGVHADGADSVLRDEVLVKADGAPTYSFACVVDDALMGITHVIRGEDHISNTPKQILMYDALAIVNAGEFQGRIPKFAHLPLIMGEDGSRLSKRHGATAVSDYRVMGFLPEALVNYLMLLGWSPGNEEILALKKACAKFSIKKINKAAAQFNMEKLKWVNAQYLKQSPTAQLTDLLTPILRESGLLTENYDRAWLERAVELFKNRLNTLRDFIDRAGFLFVDDFKVADDVRTEHLAKNMFKAFELLASCFSKLAVFDVATSEKAFREVVSELGLQSSDLVHPVRVALTGSPVGPGLFETMAMLGKEKTLARLRHTFTMPEAGQGISCGSRKNVYI